ncbi:MAG: hypothetical protein LBG98_01890 [Puniceicoccales bacterium]|jgi:hypothetical protein|nr:hypothetical protein [Puniceicoccales bacterium]
MKKSILSVALVGFMVHGHADPIAPEQMVTILQEKLPANIQNFSQQIVLLKSVQPRKRLIDLMIPYVTLLDLTRARNANALMTMPYIANLCPQNQRRSLEERRVTIGCLDTETLCCITKPALELLYLSGRDIEGFRNDVPTSDSSEYYVLYETMGPLAQIYLDAKLNQDNPGFVLPEFEDEVLPTLIACPNPNDKEIPLRNHDGSINPEYFEKWYDNIHDVYNISQINLSVLSWLFSDSDRSHQIFESLSLNNLDSRLISNQYRILSQYAILIKQ